MSKPNGFHWVLTTILLVGKGFSVGLNRRIWQLFWVLTIVWLAIASFVAYNYGEVLVPLLMGVGAPLVVAKILSIIERVVLAIFGKKLPE